jgi:hypothetical protein
MGVLLVAKELLVLIHRLREVGSIQLLVFALTLPLAATNPTPLMVSTDRSVETIFISASGYCCSEKIAPSDSRYAAAKPANTNTRPNIFAHCLPCRRGMNLLKKMPDADRMIAIYARRRKVSFINILL